MAFHIVVIDDDLALQEFYRLLFEGEGYKVTILSPFAFSPDSIAAFQADLFILDLLIGGKQDGWSMLQTLLATPQTASLPVILSTALPASQFEEKWAYFIRQRNISLVTKPFDVDALLTTVKLLLSRASIPLED